VSPQKILELIKQSDRFLVVLGARKIRLDNTYRDSFPRWSNGDYIALGELLRLVYSIQAIAEKEVASDGVSAEPQG
jgi:hypothetical protein